MRSVLVTILLAVVLHYSSGCGDKDHGPTTPPADSPSVEEEVRAAFADTALAEAVLAALSRTPVPLDSLTQLTARGRGITVLTGIGRLSSLRSLDLADNQIRDLAPLADLDSLVFLDLANNRIEDVAVLAGLERLQTLILDLNPVRDLTPLLELPGLASLELLGCPLENADEQLSRFIAGGVSVTRTDGGGGPAPTRGSLVFASDRGGDFDLYAVDLDGANLVNLTRHPAGDYLPRWSSDATRIAFVSDREGDPEIFLMEAAGTGLTNLTRHPSRDHWPAWSPDGTRLAFTSDREGNYDIYLVEATGGEPVNLTRSPAMDFAPSWSPDGSRIAYASADQASAHEIWVVELSGGNLVRLTDNPASDLNPVWSPDGSRIAFMSDRDQASGSYDLWLMSSDGTDQANLTRRAGDLVVSNNMDPTWSPDGAFLAFASSRQGNLDICLVSAGGGEVTVLTTSPAADYEPSWSPRSVREYVTEIPPEPEAPTLPDSSATQVVFADPRLEAAVRDALHSPTGTLTRGDVQVIDKLEGENQGIASLAGIEYLTSLRLVYLNGNQISNLTPLSHLSQIVWLSLTANQLDDDDLPALAPLVHLSGLTLDDNRLSDLAPLAGLTRLMHLQANGNQIVDLRPLAGLTQLEWLRLGRNQIRDLSPLSGLTKLRELALSRNQIEDISPILDLTRLEQLRLIGNPLDEAALNLHLPAFRARGVEVSF